MALASKVDGEEIYRIAFGQGMYTAELSSNIPDGYATVAYNMVATGDSVENRIGTKAPSVSWCVFEAPPTSQFIDNMYNICTIDPWSNDSSKPAFAWASQGASVPGNVANNTVLNMVRAEGTHDANDGFLATNLPAAVTGICQYNGTMYFSMNAAGVNKVTAINWATDTITYSNIATSGTQTVFGLFTFKDRLWAWNNNGLYFTDIAPTGGLPETWAFASNLIKFVGPNGRGYIKTVVPLGNKLAVFTSNGFFTLLVEGAPASWILRLLDSRSISTCSQCAFETKGIIYYVNTQGVWATNNLSITKMSMVIDDQWFLAKGARVHSIVPYEDGMIVSIAKLTTTNKFRFDAPNCRVFYSKLDPVGWSEWNFNRYDMGSRAENLAMVVSVSDKVPTYLNAEPTVYGLFHITDSKEGAVQASVLQFRVFDGGSDVYIDRTNTIRTLPVGMYLKTKHVDGENPYALKLNKQGMLEVFTSDESHDFTTSWDFDYTTDTGTEVVSTTVFSATVGTGSNHIRIPSQFRYRRMAFNFRAQLQADESQVKLKDIAIRQDTGRAVAELVQ